jgi:hypothetical protein
LERTTFVGGKNLSNERTAPVLEAVLLAFLATSQRSRPMTNFRVLSILLAVCASAVLYVGCDSGTAVVKDKYNQLDKYLKDKTVLARANVQLDESTRGTLKEELNSSGKKDSITDDDLL